MVHRHIHLEGTGSDDQDCPFFKLDPARVIAANELAVAVLDNYPVTPDHTLIIPKRHMESLFEATEEERTALLDLLAEVRKCFRAGQGTGSKKARVRDGGN